MENVAAPVENASPVIPDGAVSKIVDGDNNVDIDAIKELSALQRARRHETQAKVSKKQMPQEDIELEDGELKKTADEASEGGELNDESASEESSEEESSSEEEEQEVDPDEVKEEEKVDSRRFVVAKSGDKSLKVPKDAIIPVTVNGEVQQLPLQEILDKASGAINLHQRSSELGRKEAKIKKDIQEVEAVKEDVKSKLDLLMEAANSGSPEQVIELYATITGKDPNRALETLVTNAIKYAEEFAGLTERERALLNENRRFKWSQTLETKKAEAAQKKQATLDERSKVEATLQSNGLTWDDWFKAAEDLKGQLERGELDDTPDAFKVAEYAMRQAHEGKVRQAITSVSQRLEGKEDLFKNVSNAVLKYESLTGEKMSVQETAQLVRAAHEKYKNSLRESLSRKAEVAKKVTSPNSKNAKPQKQVKKNSAVSLRDHWDRING